MPVDVDRLVQNIGAAAQFVAPVAVAEDGHRVAGTGMVVLRRDGAAKERLEAEHGEIAAGNQQGASTDALAAEGEIGGDLAEACQPSHTLRVRLQATKHRVAEDVILVAGIVRGAAAVFKFVRRSQQDQLFRPLHRQRCQHDLVQQRKNGGIGADAEAERYDHDQAEQRSPGQTAKRVADAGHE